MLRISKTPTEWIAIRAGVDSEHESVDYALLNITEGEISSLASALAVAIMAKGTPGIGSQVDSICFDRSPEGWYVYDYEHFSDEESEAQESLERKLNADSWCFVTFDAEEDLKETEYPYDYDKFYMDPEGHLKFTAFGKYSGCRAWTAQIPFQSIIEAMEPATV